MKSSRLRLLITGASIIGLISIFVFWSMYSEGGEEGPPTVKEVEKLNFNFTVEVVGEGEPPKIVASKKLDFGKVPQGMKVKKDIILHNSKKSVVSVRSIVSVVEGELNGSVSDWISFEFEEFNIEPGRDFKEGVYLEVPQDAELGVYTGNVRFEITEK